MKYNKIILNEVDIAISRSRIDTLNIIKAGLKRIDPRQLFESNLSYDPEFNSLKVQNKTYDLLRGRIFVIGGGKAAGLMAIALEDIIGIDNITAGTLNCNSTDYKPKKIKICRAAHPVPNSGGVAGVNRMLDMKKKYKIGEGDLVISLISGGASAIMPLPVDSIKLSDKQKTTKLLMESGADIYEINTVRKHLSKIKGGQLAEFFSPAKVVSIIISDVIGNNLSVIASGPTSLDPTTFRDAHNVILKYDLLGKLPVSARQYIELGCNNKAKETPKELDNADNFIIGDNNLALETMALAAKSSGLNPKIITPEISGDPAAAAKKLAIEIISGKYVGYSAILADGETTPKLPEKHGKGGRNQHFTAVFLEAMREYRGDWALASLGTDGSDYLPGIAGAIVSGESLEIARSKKISISEYINNYDTYALFKKLGNSLIKTGNTGTNVGDIIVFVG